MKNLKLLLLAASCASSPSTGGGSALNSELMKAARLNNANRARRLIEAGADMDFQDEEGKTPLMTAAEEGSAEVVQLLIESGAASM